MKLQVNASVTADYSPDWSELRKWLDGTFAALPYVWSEDELTFMVAVPDGSVVRTCSFNKDSDAGTEFEAAWRLNRPLVPRDSLGRPNMAVNKPDGSGTTLYSHDWTDPTTWYEAAVRVVDEVATDYGDHVTYTLEHQNLIDTYHGKITQEDFLKDAAGHSFRVVVKVDGVAKTERDPHFGTGGDYTVNYATGTVHFLSAQSPSAVVTVTHHYATTSVFTVKPLAGKRLMIDFVEVQFSDDVEITDSVLFQPRGYVDVFAPQLLQANGGPLPSGTKIPLGDPFVYKTMRDFQNDAVKAYARYTAMGGAGWRGMQKDTVVLDWDYTKAKPLIASAGLEIQIKLQHDVPFGGSYATATFYGSSQAE